MDRFSQSAIPSDEQCVHYAANTHMFAVDEQNAVAFIDESLGASEQVNAIL